MEAFFDIFGWAALAGVAIVAVVAMVALTDRLAALDQRLGRAKRSGMSGRDDAATQPPLSPPSRPLADRRFSSVRA